ncbi:CapA family protein [Paenibacillus lycopersici]|uniref:CapA family protein n=2 Tax=Paenibacillus lycopersici TaxID=2704462 RepID=A0A6C0G8J6_9BACL|nr:CapA family protein [Paenibacillus lycopersici]
MKPPVDEGTYDATLIAVGDIMMHSPQLPGALDKHTGLYDFKPFFEQVKPIIERGDWSLANLETPIAGKSLGLSGYPRFNAPPELADALKDAGFTIVTNANNHALDRGSQGIAMTLAKLQKLGLVTKGTARSRWEADQLTIEKRNGISMGLLAYTYGTNGIPLPKNQPYAVTLIDEQAMIKDIHRLKAAGADFITIALHFGIEYQTTPNEAQTKLARALIAAGADIVAGSHPHVVQPYEFAEVKNPDGSVRKGLIIYSMGNFISNQRGDTKDFGVIYQVAVHKDHGATTIGSVKAIPTWVHRTTVKGLNHYAVVPIASALASKTKPFPEMSAADYGKLKSTYAVVAKRIESLRSKPVHLQAAP